MLAVEARSMPVLPCAQASRFHRQMTSPIFHRERISDFELFDTHAEHAGTPPDMVARFTMDTVSALVRRAQPCQGPTVPMHTASSAPPAHTADPASVFAVAFQEHHTAHASGLVRQILGLQARMP
ncbi:hypothetical protein GGX14DRAFT_619696 [Mycena pura]|uniref:Uncharacterized protein n=1 Tax=Mycena pura TaxID=153505 RepID=A0AAD6VH89_9AGAR|nr:hypothetical protein GGX14DRAFT_619696 [Mycena pura]